MLEDVADHMNIPYKARAKIGKIADTIKANAQVFFDSIPTRRLFSIMQDLFVMEI